MNDTIGLGKETLECRILGIPNVVDLDATYRILRLLLIFRQGQDLFDRLVNVPSSYKYNLTVGCS